VSGWPTARRGRAIAVLVAAALAGAVPAARAEPVKLPSTRAVLDVPAGWTPQAGDANRGLIAAYRGERGAVLAVTRAPVPNPDAYQAASREAYADLIERGIAARVKGYRRVGRKLGEPNGTAALDLEARRADGATLVIRVLLFQTYALSLAIEVPAGADARGAREIAASFAPPKP